MLFQLIRAPLVRAKHRRAVVEAALAQKHRLEAPHKEPWWPPGQMKPALEMLEKQAK